MIRSVDASKSPRSRPTSARPAPSSPLALTPKSSTESLPLLIVTGPDGSFETLAIDSKRYSGSGYNTAPLPEEPKKDTTEECSCKAAKRAKRCGGIYIARPVLDLTTSQEHIEFSKLEPARIACVPQQAETVDDVRAPEITNEATPARKLFIHEGMIQQKIKSVAAFCAMH